MPPLLPGLVALSLDSSPVGTPWVPPPCPEGDLAYDDNEVLNAMHGESRKQGTSSKFLCGALDERLKTFSVNDPDAAKACAAAAGAQSLFTVLEELYRTDIPTTDAMSTARYESGDAFGVGTAEQVIPQYRLKKIAQPQTVVHVVSNGEFWHCDTRLTTAPSRRATTTRALRFPKAGDVCSTRDVVWANTDPAWTWQSHKATKPWRCFIQLPAGTTMIIDRSPVDGESRVCQTTGGKRSLFADVLLPPAHFEIVEVILNESHAEVRMKVQTAMRLPFPPPLAANPPPPPGLPVE